MVYIYALCEPTPKLEIRYIGKTIDPDKRYLSSLKEINKYTTHYKSRWLATLQQAGLSPVMTILSTAADDAWEAEERAWIAFGREQGWRLTNMTPGGEGQPKGWVPPREAVERVAAKRKGRKPDPEVVERVAAKNRGRKYDEAHRARCSARQRRTWQSTPEDKKREWNKKRVDALTGRKRANASSRYQGVRFFKRDGTWQAYRNHKGKQTHLGYFKTEEAAAEAVRVYCRANGLIYREPADA